MESSVLAPASLTDLYRAYIDCLNRQDWDELGRYVDDEVEHNGRPLKLSGYRDMLLQDFEDIPDLRFNIQLLLSTPRSSLRASLSDAPQRGNSLG
jgi:predicted ester cyclase